MSGGEQIVGSNMSPITLRQGGLSDFTLKTGLYIARRVARRASGWVAKLNYLRGFLAIDGQDRRRLRGNEVLRGIHHGRRCFVIGNGPSINSQDLAPLAAELTFVTNEFFRHPVLQQWQPRYYFLSDPMFFDGSVKMRDFFRQLTARVEKAHFFIPQSAKGVVEQQVLLDPGKTHFAGFAGDLADDPEWTPDLTRILPGVRTVTQFAVLTAMYMGCSPIYLMGLDHDWLAHKNLHYTFYRVENPEHHNWNYRDLMEAVLTMWKGYESIRKVAHSLDLRIINVTRGGFLDVFERADYESVFNSARRTDCDAC
jgi:hypothetical protein